MRNPYKKPKYWWDPKILFYFVSYFIWALSRVRETENQQPIQTHLQAIGVLLRVQLVFFLANFLLLAIPLSVCYYYYSLIQYRRETVSDIWITNANTSQFGTDTNTETFSFFSSTFFLSSWFPSRIMITKANGMPKDSDSIHRIKICFNAIIWMNICSHLYWRP